MRSKYVHALLVLALFLAWSLPAFSEISNFQHGWVLFNQNKLREALPFLEKGVEDDPRNPNALYYYALTLHKLGKKDDAVDNYRRLVLTFPDTSQSVMAKSALMNLDPAAYKRLRGMGGPQDKGKIQYKDPNTDDQGYFRGSNQLQFKVRLPYMVKDGKMCIDTLFNGCWPARCFVETNRPFGYMPAYLMSKVVPGTKADNKGEFQANVQVGQYSRSQQKFRVVTSADPYPTLGKDFFSGYNVQVRQQDRVIELALVEVPQHIEIKRQKGEFFEVPYFLEGSCILVEVDFGNGRRCKMDLHGREMYFLFNRQQWDAVEPECSLKNDEQTAPDPTNENMAIVSQNVRIKYARLGEIAKYDQPGLIRDYVNPRYPESVKYNTKPYPEMPESFYGGWQLRLDDKRRVARFAKLGMQR